MRNTLFFILSFIALGFSYIDIQAWKYVLATIVIVYSYNKIYSFKFKDVFGLRFKKKQFIPYIITSIICAIAFNFYIEQVLTNSEVTRTSPLTFLLWFIQPLFQSLNEEMFFRAQYFHHIQKIIKKKLYQSLLFSIVFSLGHGVFFKLALGVSIGFNVYLSLFVATLIMNHLYFAYQNIILSWAVHFGINFSFFGGKYFIDGEKLIDPQIFNLIIGDDKILLPSIIALVLFSIFLTLRKNRI